MGIETLGTVLREIGRLLSGGTTGNLTDAQLIERFVAEGDPLAFETLMARHGPMVLSVCRGILRDPNDAEDAFQATFLILFRKAAAFGDQVALAGWLHVVAHRVAIQASVSASRRRMLENEAGERSAQVLRNAPTGRDERLRALHEEIAQLPERTRLPLVLCELEGVSQQRAAAELNLSKRTLRRRLDEGRRRLKARLERRGLEHDGGMLAALFLRESQAGVPTGVKQALRAALAANRGASPVGTVSTAASLLCEEVLKTMMLEKLKVLAFAVLGLGLLSVAALAVGLSTGKEPRPDTAAQPAPRPLENAPLDPLDPVGKFPVHGRVLDPAGMPVAGAEVLVQPYHFNQDAAATSNVVPTYQVGRVAVTDRDGRFAFDLDKSASDFPYRDYPAWHGARIAAVGPGLGAAWLSVGSLLKGEEAVLRLAPDDVPIRGRVLDLEGRPVAGVSVFARELIALNPGVDPDALLASGVIDFGKASSSFGGTSWLGRNGRWTTDADGRFEIRGVGRDQIVRLEIRGPSIEKVDLCAMARPFQGPAPARPGRPAAAPRVGPPPPTPLFGATFDQPAAPTKPITGTVRQASNQKPVADVQVIGLEPNSHTEVSAHTDAQGRFRLVGLPKASSYEVRVAPRPGIDPFLEARVTLSDTEGLKPIETEIPLPRGVILTGRLVDAATGKGIRAKHVSHLKLPSNRNAGDAALSSSGLIDPTFRITVPPGPGMIYANVRGEGSRYVRARLRAEDKGKGIGGMEDREARMMPLGAYQAYRIIDIPEDAKNLDVELPLTLGASRKGTVVGPDGRPVVGARCMGLVAQMGQSQTIDGNTFEVLGLERGHPRLVVFAHKERGLVGSVRLGDDDLKAKDPLVVRLDRGGSIKGRLLDHDGQPLARASLSVLTFDAEGHNLGMALNGGLWPEADPIATDADGRFQVDGLKPGVPSRISVGIKRRRGFRVDTGKAFDRVLVKNPGEVLDVGDVTVKEVGRD